MSEKKFAVVIDDDQFIRQLLESVLRELGYATFTYESALELPCVATTCSFQCTSGKQAPDILITDIKMPGMTGIEFLLNIKNKGCSIQRKAIISGFWEENHLKAAEELNCRKIAKPFQIEEIKKWLNEE